jgi:hypothetical protein
MVDLTTNLGRDVATAQQVLEVIRPELRIMRAHYQGEIAAMRAGWLEASPDLELTDGGDEHASGVVFAALQESAIESVGQWARDMDLVFDKAKVAEFIRCALIDAMVTVGGCEQLPPGALDY